ncbi:hypothetical protein OAN58_02885 [Paracoccaceae bacterium]|nr:hypothetical protein [Paracoccaceae bacterium]
MKGLPMNTLKFSLVTGALSLMASSAVALDCTAAANSSSDYCLAVASQESWTEDSANDFIQGANSFACVIANSAPGTNANRTYLALISEEACGLNEPDPDAKSSATVYTPGYTVSSWAGEGLTQEVVTYFDSIVSGNRYIANVNLRKTAETLEPFGSWYFSYYLAGGVIDEDAEVLEYESYTPSDGGDYGYVDIAEDGSDVTIISTQFADDSGSDCGDGSTFEMASKTKYIEGSSDNTLFIGKVRQNCALQNRDETFYTAGQTTADLYFKLSLDSDGAALGEQCLDRDAEWNVAHDLQLYSTTGEKQELDGGFGFSLADGARGYMGNWGAWIESADIQFSPSSSSIDITAETGTATKLVWSPGRLRTQTAEQTDLADGDIFDTWIDDDNYYIQWDAENKTFILAGTENAYMPTSEIWMWSSAKRSSVVYTPADDGEDANTTITVMVESDQTFASTLASATSTTFKGRWFGNHGDLDALPYTYAEWSEQGYGLSNDGGNTRKTYHYTGTTPGGTFEPYTLYLDDGNGELSANDKPVRFDFAVNEKKTKYRDFTSSETKSYEAPDAWPAEGHDLILASEDGDKENCDTGSNEVSGCTRYLWNFGAFPWDNDIAAADADGAFVTIEEPIRLTMTFDETDDRNEGQTMTFSTKDLYNTALPGCVQIGTGNDAYKKCTDVDVSLLEGDKINLEFDGNQVHGRPGVRVCNVEDCSTDSGYWTFAANPKDGTRVTDSNGTEYLLAARGLSKAYATANAGACDTAGISFDAVTDENFAFGIADIPELSISSTDYPLPSQSWSDKPADSALECTVTMGDATNCDALDES